MLRASESDSVPCPAVPPQTCARCTRCRSCQKAEIHQYVGNLPLCANCFQLHQRGNYCPLCGGCYEDDDYDTKVRRGPLLGGTGAQRERVAAMI